MLTADDPALARPLAEPLAELIAALAGGGASSGGGGYTHVLAPSTTFGKNVLPRAAALLGAQPAADVTAVVDADTFVRPIYAGNALATIMFASDGAGGGSALRMLTVRPTSFKAAAPADGADGAAAAAAAAPVEAVPAELLAAALARAPAAPEWVSESARAAGARPDLGSAKVVVAGGRALKSKENFLLLERLADLLGGAVAASRAAVDAGYVANDLQARVAGRGGSGGEKWGGLRG